MGVNTLQQGPNANGTQCVNGYYYLGNEAFLSRFMRLPPNNVSEPTQCLSPSIGRYTLIDDLNRFAGFRQSAIGC